MSRLDRAALDRHDRQMERLERKPTRTSIVEGMVTGAAALPVAPMELVHVKRESGRDVRIQIVEEGEKPSGMPSPAEKHGKGLYDGDEDAPEIPKNNLWLVMPALGLVAFVAALDQTVVATALPTIAADFGATPSQYAWVGTSYLLTQTLMTPINGRVTDIIGRKPMLYSAVFILMVFDILCGAAKNITWLIVARAFAGLGGGSTVSLTLIVISDIVPLQQRGIFQGYMSASWAMASVLGPIVGGILTQKVSWRWCFYINGPICGLALLALIFTLNLNPTKGHTWSELRQTFDFPGLALIMVVAALYIVGFSSAADKGFNNVMSYALIATAGGLTLLLLLHILFTKRNAIIPPRMLKVRTTVFFLIASFFNSFMFMPAVYLLPQFFQGVMGDDALQSGIQLIPMLVCVSGASMIAGQITSRLGIVRPVCWVGFGLAAIGYGLFYGLYGPNMSNAVRASVQVVCGLGVGLSLAATMLIIQAAMPMKDMASATAAWVLLRSMGATVGVAITQAIFNSGMRSKLAQIPGYGVDFEAPKGAKGYAALQALPPGPMRNAVLQALSDSFKPVWIMGSAMLASALIMTLFTKSYSLTRGKPAASRTSSGETTVCAEEEDAKVDIEQGLAEKSGKDLHSSDAFGDAGRVESAEPHLTYGGEKREPRTIQ